MEAKELQHHSQTEDLLIPICVDLDQTLIQTDSLLEAMFNLLKHKPLYALLMPFYALRGMAHLKAKVCDLSSLDAIHLPYNSEVFFYLKRMVKRGRKAYLVTGANRKIADSVAKYLGIFTDVYSSDAKLNLVGKNKAALLINKFGEKGFEYIGDSRHDLEVWKHAKNAIVVSNSSTLIEQAKKLTHVDKVISTPASRYTSIVKAIRIHQWVKNTLIFLPMALAHAGSNVQIFIDTVIAFFSFSFMASAIYVINDLSDLEADRQHDVKKHRPFASGALPISAAGFLIPSLLMASVTTAAFLQPRFWFMLATYALMTNIYTFFIKRIPMADIVMLSSLYSIRLIAGSVVSGIAISPWLTAFTGFLFISLAMIKRCSELLMLKSKGATETIGRGYSVVDIPVMVGFGSASGYGSILVLALYINSEVAKSHYKTEELLWLICPLMIFWISRMWFLANRGKIHSDPVKFAMTDHMSWLIMAVSAGIWFTASNFQLF